MYGTYLLARILGFGTFVSMFVFGLFAYLFVRMHFDWEDPPSGWRTACLKLRVIRPSHQTKLWDAINDAKLSEGGLAVAQNVNGFDPETLIEKIVGSIFTMPDGEIVHVCHAVKAWRGPVVVAWASGGPRPKGRGGKRRRVRAPQIGLGELLPTGGSND